jgi:hypothetical protein
MTWMCLLSTVPRLRGKLACDGKLSNIALPLFFGCYTGIHIFTSSSSNAILNWNSTGKRTSGSCSDPLKRHQHVRSKRFASDALFVAPPTRQRKRALRHRQENFSYEFLCISDLFNLLAPELFF